MTLDNLMKIGRIKTHTTSAAEIGDLLAAATRNLAVAPRNPVARRSRAHRGLARESRRTRGAGRAFLQCGGGRQGGRR